MQLIGFELPLSNFLNFDIDYLNIVTLKNLLTMTSGYVLWIIMLMYLLMT